MRARTYYALHTVKRGGIEHPPGAHLELDDPDEVERLLRLGAICLPADRPSAQGRHPRRREAGLSGPHPEG